MTVQKEKKKTQNLNRIWSDIVSQRNIKITKNIYFTLLYYRVSSVDLICPHLQISVCVAYGSKTTSWSDKTNNLSVQICPEDSGLYTEHSCKIFHRLTARSVRGRNTANVLYNWLIIQIVVLYLLSNSWQYKHYRQLSVKMTKESVNQMSVTK